MDAERAKEAIGQIIDALDMATTIAPRSDQLNADDLIPGPRVVTITAVKRGTAEQPVNIITAEFGPKRPYKPCLSMRRVLVAAWGTKAQEYVGRRLMLYRDPDVTYGGAKVGGIRISAMSGISTPVTVVLTVNQKQRRPFTVEPLREEATKKESRQPSPAALIAAFKDLGVTVQQLELKVGADHEQWTAEEIADLAALGKAIKSGSTTVAKEFDFNGIGEES